MQCHVSTEDKTCWANWSVLVCQADSLPYAETWLQLFPGCIDSSKINRYMLSRGSLSATFSVKQQFKPGLIQTSHS